MQNQTMQNRPPLSKNRNSRLSQLNFSSKENQLYSLLQYQDLNSLKIELDLAKSKLLPFFREITLDWNKNHATLQLHTDLENSLDSNDVQQLLMAEAAKIALLTNETISPASNGYVIALQEMEEMTGVLTLNLDALANRQCETLLQTLRSNWHPTHSDLTNLPIVTESEYEKLSSQCKKIAMSHCRNREESPSLLAAERHFLIFARAYEGAKDTPEMSVFLKDFQRLSKTPCEDRGFIAHSRMKRLCV